MKKIDLLENFLLKNKIDYQKDIFLKDFTTIGIGGISPFMINPNSISQFRDLLSFLKENDLTYKIIGKGSNLIVNDKPLDIVFISTKNLSYLKIKDNFIKAGAGTLLNHLCTIAMKNSLSGLEFASAIPGSTGGAIIMNAGAFGKEIKDVIKNITFLNSQNEIKTLPKEYLSFSYRSFDNSQINLILEATFELEFANKSSIEKNTANLIMKRAQSQPLNEKSAGCIFKNPKNNYAGKLIDELGLKGYRIGGAVISEKHANFIVNRDKASFLDVMNLIDYVRKEVNKNFGISLELEVLLIP